MKFILFLIMLSPVFLFGYCPSGCLDPMMPSLGTRNIIKNYLNLDQKMADRYKNIDKKIQKSIEKDKKILDNTQKRLKLYSLRNLWLRQTVRNVKNTNSIIATEELVTKE